MQSSPQRRIGFKSGVLVSLILISAAASFSQSLGDIARQERERKNEQPSRATYVYTEDDLKRDHILVPEDRERVLAARRNASTPAVQVAQNPAPSVPAFSVSSSPAPVLAPPSSVSIVAVMPTPVTSEKKFNATQDAASNVSARNNSQSQVSAPPFITAGELEALLASAGRKTARSTVVRTSTVRPNTMGKNPVVSVASRSDFATPQPQPAAMKRELIDSDTVPIITVERGDSLWKLAKMYLGTGARWRELAALNTQTSDVNVIHVGEWIRLPGQDVQTARNTMALAAHVPGSIAKASVLIPSPMPALTAQIASHQRFYRP
jgi:nucleoid-associated protein YgaU